MGGEVRLHLNVQKMVYVVQKISHFLFLSYDYVTWHTYKLCCPDLFNIQL